MSDQHYERKRPTEDTGGLGIDTKVKNTKPTTLIRFMKAVNIVTALFLIVVGILHILGGPDLIGILASIYVIMFSGILLLFEFRWKRLEKKVVRNFGFMFSWSGRAMFLLFVGTLAFGLGDIGIGCGVCTIIAVIINIYVIRTHPELREMILDQDWEARQRAEGRDLEAQAMKAVDATKAAGAAGAAAVAGAATNAQNKIQKMAEPKPGNTADGNPSGDQWEKLFDESTQQYYYHNHATGETKWSI